MLWMKVQDKICTFKSTLGLFSPLSFALVLSVLPSAVLQPSFILHPPLCFRIFLLPSLPNFPILPSPSLTLPNSPLPPLANFFAQETAHIINEDESFSM